MLQDPRDVIPGQAASENDVRDDPWTQSFHNGTGKAPARRMTAASREPDKHLLRRIPVPGRRSRLGSRVARIP